MKNLRIYHISYLFALSILVSCGSEEKNVETTEQSTIEANEVTLTQKQFNNSSITTGKLEEKEIEGSLLLNGKIELPPQNLITVGSIMDGNVTEIKPTIGMAVRKGQLLAQIKNPEIIQWQQDYLLAKNRLEYAELNYKRQKELNGSKASSDKITQEAYSEMKTQQILMNTLGEKLSLLSINPNSISSSHIVKFIPIYSPINGFVTKIEVNNGKFVSTQDPLFELVDPKSVHLSLKAYEKDLDQLTVGQKILAYSSTQPKVKFPARLISINPSYNEGSSVELHCDFEQFSSKLIAGTFMKAEIKTGKQTVDVLPNSAIVDYKSKKYAFVEVSKNTYKMIEINVLKEYEAFTTISTPSDYKNATFVKTGSFSLLLKLKNTGE